jgi:hypothetical protein
MKKHLFLIMAFVGICVIPLTSFKNADSVSHHRNPKQVFTYGFTYTNSFGVVVQLSGEGTTHGNVQQLVYYGSLFGDGTVTGTFTGTDGTGSGTCTLDVKVYPTGLPEQTYIGEASYVGE